MHKSIFSRYRSPRLQINTIPLFKKLPSQTYYCATLTYYLILNSIDFTDEFNEVVGVWGEIYLINLFIEATASEKRKYEFIDSWEGIEDRTIIDFNVKSKKIKIEVKTTAQSIRVHHFNGLSQMNRPANWNCYLASLCISSDESGLTCSDLVKSIRKKITLSTYNLLEKKINIRGESCLNDKYRFVVNPDKKMEFFMFENVPKPTIVPGIGKIAWEAVLENITCLKLKDKIRLLEIMN